MISAPSGRVALLVGGAPNLLSAIHCGGDSSSSAAGRLDVGLVSAAGLRAIGSKKVQRPLVAVFLSSHPEPEMGRPGVEIRVLGPLEVEVDGDVVDVGGHNQRAVLVALVLSLNHAISADQLAFAVWGDDPPQSAHGTLQTYISHLRGLLGDCIHFTDNAYTLRLDPAAVDLVRFEGLVEQARSAISSELTKAKDPAVRALQLWRGPAFGDLGDEEFAALEAQRLDLLRMEAVELRLEADIELGDHEAAIGHLRTAVADDPYREHLWYLLMIALARAGRRVEALRAYRKVATLLAETGLDPSDDLQELEQQILQDAPQVKARLHRNNPGQP